MPPFETCALSRKNGPLVQSTPSPHSTPDETAVVPSYRTLRMLTLVPVQVGVELPMPVQLNCTESLLSELTPVAVSEAPPVASELSQPRPGPEGGFAHGQLITPDVPGWQVTVPCADASGAKTADASRSERDESRCRVIEGAP